MSDDLLFAQLPYMAILACAIAFAIRSLRLRSATVARGAARRPVVVQRAILACGCTVAALHTLLLVAPATVRRWNLDSTRLRALEAIGAAAGLVLSLAVLDALRRSWSDAAPRPAPLARTLNVTVATIAIVSGVTVALSYRWAASWSVVTLTPYLASVIALQPRVSLVGSTPFVVRLHVLGAFACMATLPFADIASDAIAIIGRSVAAVTASAKHVLAAARAGVDLARVGDVRTRRILSEKER